MPTKLLVTADDRTGAFECGGIIAGEGFPVPTGPTAESEICCVVDIDTRQIDPSTAADRISRAQGADALYRSHKMDAGLRGNWAHEVYALAEMGLAVAIVPSFPDAGRRCKDGVVYINDVPVLESPFGSDPLTAPISNRPDEVLEDADCVHRNIVIWDANDSHELNRAAARCLAENRVMVGPAGAVGAFADQVLPARHKTRTSIKKPLLIVCGSLNATSRGQLEAMNHPTVTLGEAVDLSSGVAVVVSEIPTGTITSTEARHKAVQMAEVAYAHLSEVATLIVIGGDTSAAIVGDETLEVLGTVDAGIPISRFRGKLLITKGGGIGTRETVATLVQRAFVN